MQLNSRIKALEKQQQIKTDDAELKRNIQEVEEMVREFEKNPNAHRMTFEEAKEVCRQIENLIKSKSI